MESDLIERLVLAEEGSRELSDEVLLALGWRQYMSGTAASAALAWGYMYWSNGNRVWTEDSRPSPTTNLQEAVNCVPEGWVLLRLEQLPEPAGYCASLAATGKGAHGENLACGNVAEGFALALCAAILRARGKNKT